MNPREKRNLLIALFIATSLVIWLSWGLCSDEDDDGYVRWFGLGSDCDDGYNRGANTYPGAPELCDGRDNDCDGDIDEGHQTFNWCPDNDEDGYGANHGTEVAPAVFRACGQFYGWGYSEWAPNCNDPDDTNPGIVPTE